MKTNDRLGEAKKFALRTLKERSESSGDAGLLWKVISFGGDCNALTIECDWTRDISVVNAAIKGLYVRGARPLGSALEFAIDEIKKSAYPDETQAVIITDGINTCGSLPEIVQRRLPEIPCVRFLSLGIELSELPSGTRASAIDDIRQVANLTKGRFLLLDDARQMQGITLRDTGFSIQTVVFQPRAKSADSMRLSKQNIPQTTAQATTQPTAQNADSSKAASNQAISTQTSSTQATVAQNQPASQQASEEKVSEKQAPTKQAPTKQDTEPQTRTSVHTSSPTTTDKPSKQEPSEQAEQTKEASTASKLAKQKTPKEKLVSKRLQKALVVSSQENAVNSQEPSPQAQESSTAIQKPRKQKSSKQESSGQASRKAKNAPKAKIQEQPPAERPQKIARTKPVKTLAALTDTVFVDTAWVQNRIFFFGNKSSALIPASLRAFEDFCSALRGLAVRYPAMKVSIEGHSSEEGSRTDNLRIAVSRASEIAKQIRRNVGLNDTAVVWNAFGAMRPRSPFQNDNRRVEIVITW